jgi:hypothetical protein
MVFRQALDVVFEGIDRTGRDDAGLPHGTAELMFPPPGRLNKIR